ncbi:MAG: NAD(P)H-hydrate epimerase [Pseudomonadota bacterium]|nr:NAD(P)H-hydrate epimerase [Pseudomonadota bacterium]
MNDTERYYTAAEVRAMDRHAIEQLGIPAFELMHRAGTAAFNALLARWPDTQRLLVFCGTGNNGGDGFVIAALARDAGLDAQIYLVGDAANIKGTAREALIFAEARGLELHDAQTLPDFTSVSHATVVVDALLGTGLTGDLRPAFRHVIEAINRSGLPVLAVDIPSGLCSDTGGILGACVKAELTVTFIGRKRGLVSGAGPAYCGTVVFDDLGVDTSDMKK